MTRVYLIGLVCLMAGLMVGQTAGPEGKLVITGHMRVPAADVKVAAGISVRCCSEVECGRRGAGGEEGAADCEAG